MKKNVRQKASNPAASKRPVRDSADLLLCRPGFAETLTKELAVRWDIKGQVMSPQAVAVAHFDVDVRSSVFVRQILPKAQPLPANQDAALQQILSVFEVAGRRPNRKEAPWTIHAFSIDHDGGLAAARKMEKALLKEIRQSNPTFAKTWLDADAFSDRQKTHPSGFVVQIFFVDEKSSWLSIAGVAAPSTGRGVLPWPGGVQRMKRKHQAPSRSASKLEEALFFAAMDPQKGDTAVDLGAAPGGWTHVLASRGVLVTAVDKAALDLPPSTAKLVKHELANGLKYRPLIPVDWLCCDMVIAGRETLKVLDFWLKNRLMRQFVVNVKLPKSEPWPMVQEALELLQKHAGWGQFKVRQLFHDRSEMTIMGTTHETH